MLMLRVDPEMLKQIRWEIFSAVFSAGLAWTIESFRRARRARRDLDRIIDPVLFGDAVTQMGPR